MREEEMDTDNPCDKYLSLGTAGPQELHGKLAFMLISKVDREPALDFDWAKLILADVEREIKSLQGQIAKEGKRKPKWTYVGVFIAQLCHHLEQQDQQDANEAPLAITEDLLSSLNESPQMATHAQTSANLRPISTGHELNRTQLGFHFFPVRRHGDGDILALETEEWRDRGFLFGPSGVRVSPPHPELHDVMLACHADECGSSVLDYCVVRMVFAREDEANASQLPAGTENLLEDIADVTDQTSAEQAGGEVQVQRIRQNGTSSWVMRPGACCSTIPFRHLRKLCDNFTVVAYTGDKPCQWIGG
ncbi:hypothetical protein R1sor_000765 [Riccia sorocarpa]|uniref:Uncharacterized protein n=1 Tax=Riccia sorocarpa TaxID=122646 RepID=A0ABD3GU36_9MARC